MERRTIAEGITSYLVRYNFISRYKDIKYIGTQIHVSIQKSYSFRQPRISISVLCYLIF